MSKNNDEVMGALTALYLEVPASVAEDVKNKVMSRISGLEEENRRLREFDEADARYLLDFIVSHYTVTSGGDRLFIYDNVLNAIRFYLERKSL